MAVLVQSAQDMIALQLGRAAMNLAYAVEHADKLQQHVEELEAQIAKAPEQASDEAPTSDTPPTPDT